MNQELFNSFLRLLSPDKLLMAAASLLAAWLITWLLTQLSRRLSKRFSRYRIGIQQGLQLTRVIIWTGAVVYAVFGALDPSAKLWLGVAASVGLAVGLAVQGFMKNFLAWLIVVFTRPFRIGDMIQVQEDYGEIIAITPNLTRMRTFQDNQVTFPTSWLLTDRISNANTGSLQEMVRVEVKVPAYLDPKELCQIAWDAAANSPYTCLSRPIVTLVDDEFDRTFLTKLILKCYVMDVRLERQQMSHLVKLMKQELSRRGVINSALVAGLLSGSHAGGKTKTMPETTPEDSR